MAPETPTGATLENYSENDYQGDSEDEFDDSISDYDSPPHHDNSYGHYLDEQVRLSDARLAVALVELTSVQARLEQTFPRRPRHFLF